MNQSFDVVVLGGGVIGLAVARELRRAGVARLAVVDRGILGSGASSAAAGMLAPDAETDELDGFYKFCRESLEMYPRFAEELLDETGVDIELDRSGTLYAAFTAADSDEVRHRLETHARNGLNVVYLTAEETRKAEPFISPDVRESIFFPDDWQVESRKVLAALRRFAELNSIHVFENTEVLRLVSEGGRVTGVETTSGRIAAGTTVLATGAWASLIKIDDTPMPFMVEPIRGQIISYKTAKRLFERVIYSPRGYLVPRADGRILIGATSEDAGFDASVTDAGTAYLKDVGFEIVPSLSGLEISDAWAGLRPLASGGHPIIGLLPETKGIVVAAGHYRNGILLSPLTGRIVADLIAEGMDSEYFGMFGLGRMSAVPGVL